MSPAPRSLPAQWHLAPLRASLHRFLATSARLPFSLKRFFFRRYTQIPLTLCSCVALCIVHRARIGPNNNDGFVINKPRSPPSPEVGKINHEKRSHIIIDFDLRATYEYEWPMSDRFYPAHRSVPAQQPPVPLLFAKHGLPLRTNTLAPGQSPLFLHRTFTATHGNMGG